jgi:hypothetical protein
MGQEFPPSRTPRQRLSPFQPEIFQEILENVIMKKDDMITQYSLEILHSNCKADEAKLLIFKL